MDEDEPISPWPIAIAAIMLTISIAGLLLLVLTGPARSQGGECGNFDQMKGALAERFGEAPIGMGMINSQSVIWLFTTADGGTWTMLAADPSGRACILSTGELWTPLETPKTPAEGERES